MPDPKIVRAQFKTVAPDYKNMQSAMAGGWDGLHRDALIKELAQSDASDILDLACGSGTLTLGMAHAFETKQKVVRITGVDFCSELLALANKALNRRPFKNVTVSFQQADVLQLPFAKESFDLLTLAFGLRYVANRPQLYAEALRVLRPGGRLLILETVQPSGWQKTIYRCCQPALVALARIFLGKEGKNFEHILERNKNFPHTDELAKEIANAGFTNEAARVLAGWRIAFYKARKCLT